MSNHAPLTGLELAPVNLTLKEKTLLRIEALQKELDIAIECQTLTKQRTLTRKDRHGTGYDLLPASDLAAITKSITKALEVHMNFYTRLP